MPEWPVPAPGDRRQRWRKPVAEGSDSQTAGMTPAADAIRDAATVVLLRRDPGAEARVLMGMRGADAAFMPSKFVFPGGAVDPADTLAPEPPDAAIDPRLGLQPRPGGCGPAALTACARRELAEETGLVLKPAAPLLFVFRAITPPGRPRRFDARFFLIDAAGIDGDPDDFTHADTELGHLCWVTLAQARALDLPFITEIVLAEVAAMALGGNPLAATGPVPFFDNRAGPPRLGWLGH